MYKKEIEKKLRAWFAIMQKKYSWLSIMFEFSEEEDCYLVSFSPSSESLRNEEFCKDALEFENNINKEYEFDAPLFCDGEDLFKLSPNAIVLPCKQGHATVGDIELISISLPVNLEDVIMVTQDSYNESVTNETFYNNKDIAA